MSTQYMCSAFSVCRVLFFLCKKHHKNLPCSFIQPSSCSYTLVVYRYTHLSLLESHLNGHNIFYILYCILILGHTIDKSEYIYLNKPNVHMQQHLRSGIETK